MTRDVQLSIIIVSFNTCDLLRRCLASVAATVADCTHEIIVVDNASTDSSVQMMEDEFRYVALLKNEHNRGFAGANNQAIGYARGRYLLLLNSDAMLKENAVHHLIRFMDEHPRAAAVGPRVLNADGSLQSKGFNFPSVTRSLLDLFRVSSVLSQQTLHTYLPGYFWNSDRSRKVDWVSGCCMALRREALDDIGCFREEFFMYYEDLEWCRRARSKGWEVWYCAAAVIIHNNLSSPFPERVGQIRIAARTYHTITNSRLQGAVISALRVLFYSTRLARSYVLAGVKEDRRHARQSLKDEYAFFLFLLK